MASTESQEALSIEVCHAHGAGVWRKALTLPRGACVGDALEQSGFRTAFPAVDPARAGVGVYGIRCDIGHVLHDGDRVEVYRPLVFDPKESRRRRARHKAATERKS
jgi:putative ubiquitin-RnfH superfamily antitoxin RatB of RatAB toxin-antitoxin module